MEGIGSHSQAIDQLESTIGTILTAGYCEKKRWYQEAANLYHKGGLSYKAIEICISNKMYDSIPLYAQTDEIIERVEGIFVALGEYNKAIDLHLKAGRPLQALELCSRIEMEMNEETMDRIISGEATLENRLVIVNKMLELSDAGSSPLATKLVEMREKLEKEIYGDDRQSKKRKLEDQQQQQRIAVPIGNKAEVDTQEVETTKQIECNDKTKEIKDL